MKLVPSHQCLQVSLTPMQIADRVDDGLVIYPGEPSEIVVQVKNLLKQKSLNLSLNVEGDFPADWCQIGTEGNTLPPGTQMEAVLYFQVPETFFEDQQAIQFPLQQRLQLQYDALITIHASDTTGTDEATTIAQSELKLYVRPRSLYLDFLPDLYREADRDDTSSQHAHEVDFIGRFLKIFEQSFEPAVQSFDALWSYLDPLIAPQAMLPFLAHWVGWNLDSDWDLATQRRLIRQAIELYRWRGTRKGLQMYLYWYTGLPVSDSASNSELDESEQHISITESFSSGFILGDAILGESTLLGGGKPFHFYVHLRANANHPADRLDEATLHRIIEQEKPAFCTYDLIIERRTEHQINTI